MVLFERQEKIWVLDSGVSCNIMYGRNFFDINPEGTVSVFGSFAQSKRILLKNVLFVPELNSNLILIQNAEMHIQRSQIIFEALLPKVS